MNITQGLIVVYSCLQLLLVCICMIESLLVVIVCLRPNCYLLLSTVLLSRQQDDKQKKEVPAVSEVLEQSLEVSERLSAAVATQPVNQCSADFDTRTLVLVREGNLNTICIYIMPFIENHHCNKNRNSIKDSSLHFYEMNQSKHISKTVQGLRGI